MSAPAVYVLPVLPMTFTSSNLGGTSPALEIGALWSLSNPKPNKALELHVFWNQGKLVAAVQVSLKDITKGSNEQHEAFCKAVAPGVKKAKECLGTVSMTEMQISIVVECSEDAHDAGEQQAHQASNGQVADETLVLYICACDTAIASQLAVYKFTLKTKPHDPMPAIAPVLLKSDINKKLNWRTRTVYAKAQNWARTVCLHHPSSSSW